MVEGYCYPQKRPAGEGLDRILIFSDKDHNGSFEDRILFAEGLNLVSGLEVALVVSVGAAPELLFIPDANQDDSQTAASDSARRIRIRRYSRNTQQFPVGAGRLALWDQGVFNTSAIGKPGRVR